MILIDETKLQYDTLYNILKTNNQLDEKEEFKLKYSPWWCELRKKNIDNLNYDEDREKIIKMWNISGEAIDVKEFVDFHLDFLGNYENIGDIKKGLIDILRNIKVSYGDIYKEIIKEINDL